MNAATTALGIACLVVWGGLWAYLVALQNRVDRLEDSASRMQDTVVRRDPGPTVSG